MIKRRSFVAGLALLLLAAPVEAGPLPHYDLSQLSIGSVMEWETDRGLQSLTYLGPDNGHLKFRLNYPTGQDANLAIDGWFTSGGQAVKATMESRSFTMVPHDCSNTVGACTYTINYGGSKSVEIEYFGTYFADGVLQSTRSASDPEFAVFVKKQCAILDRNGMSIVYFGIRADNSTAWERRINDPYEAEIDSMLALVEARCMADAPTT